MVLRAYENYLTKRYKKNTIWAYLSPIKKYINWLKGVEEDETLRFMVLQLDSYLTYLSEKQPEKTYRQSKYLIRYFFEWVINEGMLPPDLPTEKVDYLKTYIIERTRQKNKKEPLTGIIKDYENWLQGLSKNTKRSYMTQVKMFSQWLKTYANEEFKPKNITPSIIKIYRDQLASQYKPDTVNSKLMAIMSFCNFALDKGYIEINPMKRIRDLMSSGAASVDTKWLSDKEQRDLLHWLEKENNPMELAIILIMLDAGLRASEVVALNVDHVILYPVKDSNINIKDSKRYKSRQVPIKFYEKQSRGKTKHIGGRLHEALKRYLEYRDTQFGNEQEAFFINKGRRISYLFLYRLVEKYKKIVDRLTPHALRHSFCKNLLDQGARETEVAYLAGHTKKNGDPNLQMLARYTRPSGWELQRAVNKLPE